MSTQYPPLPYRRLKMMANGIWDEVNKAFYPFIVGYDSVGAKSGVAYYVKSISLAATNTGDAAAANVYVYGYMQGASSRLITGYLPATVAASNVNAAVNVTHEVNVLLDSGRGITVTPVGTARTFTLVYAEIPADLGWVVIE